MSSLGQRIPWAFRTTAAKEQCFPAWRDCGRQKRRESICTPSPVDELPVVKLDADTLPAVEKKRVGVGPSACIPGAMSIATRVARREAAQRCIWQDLFFSLIRKPMLLIDILARWTSRIKLRSIVGDLGKLHYFA